MTDAPQTRDTPTAAPAAGASPPNPSGTPPDKSKRKVNYKAVWAEARELLWARRRRLALGLALLIVNRLMSMVLPVATKIVIDEVIGKGKTGLLPAVGAATAVASVLQAITSFSLAVLLGVAAQKSINDLRLRIQRHIARLPIRFFEENKSGVLISRIMNDAEGVRNLVGTGFVQLVGGLFSASIAVAALIYLNWRLTTLIVFVLAIFMMVLKTGFKRLRPTFRERGRLNAELTGRLAEFLGGIRVVKAYTAEKREEIVFAEGAHELFRNVAKTMTGVAGVTSVSTGLFGLAAVALMILGGREVVAQRMTLGELAMYTFFIGLVVAPLIQISSIGTQLTEAFAGLDRIREIMAEPTEMETDAAKTPVGRVEGRIELEDVWFEYAPGVPVLKGVGLTAPAGATLALVGPSGSGKSTLISLIMAFNEPTRGRVLVDGADLAGVRLRDYRANLGVVLQDNFLFDGTIARNIAYGRPRAARAEIEAAGKLAHCDEFVSRFEHGYDTLIGERGVKLSGGQRQRLAIARAILADPKILILDEATSSLDSESEEMIQDGLRALRKGRTTFVIAHRLSTIRNADQILVLDGGLIVERGRHEELLRANGRYKALYDKQYKLATDLYMNPGEDFTPEPEKIEIEGAPPRRGL